MTTHLLPLIAQIFRHDLYYLINQACTQGWKEVLDYILMDGRLTVDTPNYLFSFPGLMPPADLNLPNCNNQALCCAVRAGHSPIVELLLQDDRFSINEFTSFVSACSPLEIAVSQGDYTIASLLLEDPRISEKVVTQALHIAVKNGSLDIVELLCRDQRIDLNSVIGQAAIHHQLPIIKYLLSFLGTEHLDTEDLVDALAQAARYGFDDVVQLLLPHIKSSSIEKTIQSASQTRFLHITKSLLEHDLHSTRQHYQPDPIIQRRAEELDDSDDVQDRMEEDIPFLQEPPRVSPEEWGSVKTKLLTYLQTASSHYQWDTFFFLAANEMLSFSDIQQTVDLCTLEMNIQLLWIKIYRFTWHIFRTQVFPKELIMIILGLSLSIMESCPITILEPKLKIAQGWNPALPFNEDDIEDYSY